MPRSLVYNFSFLVLGGFMGFSAFDILLLCSFASWLHTSTTGSKTVCKGHFISCHGLQLQESISGTRDVHVQGIGN